MGQRVSRFLSRFQRCSQTSPEGCLFAASRMPEASVSPRAWSWTRIFDSLLHRLPEPSCRSLRVLPWPWSHCIRNASPTCGFSHLVFSLLSTWPGRCLLVVGIILGCPASEPHWFHGNFSLMSLVGVKVWLSWETLKMPASCLPGSPPLGCGMGLTLSESDVVTQTQNKELV